jgi:hypothetical protein
VNTPEAQIYNDYSRTKKWELRIKRLLEKSWESIIKLKRWVFILIFINISFFLLGYGMVEFGYPYALEFRERQLNEIPNLSYLQPLLGALSPYLSLKILYTFLFNLVAGAFVSTTLTGIALFLPFIITMYRAWFVGVVFHGFLVSPLFTIVFVGTFILEFGAYVLSASVGISVGCALFFPERYYSLKRKEAFLASLKDGFWVYIMVMILLFLGAIWEITWLHNLNSVAIEGLGSE